MKGFWSEGEYVGMQRTILYPDEALSLDRILIIERIGTWEIFNWLQYYTPERISEEFREAGFNIDTPAGSLAGDQLTGDSKFMGITAAGKAIPSAAVMRRKKGHPLFRRAKQTAEIGLRAPSDMGGASNSL